MFNFQLNINLTIFKRLLFFTVLAAMQPSTAWANEKINAFEVEIAVNEDAVINVQEKIVYDFGTAEKHGIYREIPYKYNARGGNYTLEIKDIAVANEAGYPYQTKTSKAGGNLKIQIGDPDIYVSGQQTYVIKYSVAGAINFFDEHDELYWNVTGNGWDVPIENVLASISVPGAIERDTISTQCFEGPLGSTSPCDDSFYAIDDPSTGKARFAQDNLLPGEGVTVAVGVPKGVIKEPTWLNRLIKTARDNWIVVMPLFTFIVLFYLWRTRGRDPAGRGAIMAQYDPPVGLSPSQVGTIIDEKADQVDMSADIVHMAVNGYLKIRRLEEKKMFSKSVDYELIKLKDADESLNKPEQLLFSKLFKDNKQTVKLSDLKNEFYKDWAQVKQATYKSVVENNFFPRNPSHVRIAYATVGIALLGIIGTVAATALLGAIGAISMIISGIMVALFGIAMPVKTKKGVLMKEYILGLKRYISIAEKARIEFHNAPEKSPELFDRLLPFAMVLKVEKKWAKQFKDLYKEQPGWYEGPAGSHFNAVVLATSMSNFSSTAQSTLTSRPSSAAGGGSGFSGGGSGGGFGGGGGGSW